MRLRKWLRRRRGRHRRPHKGIFDLPPQVKLPTFDEFISKRFAHLQGMSRDEIEARLIKAYEESRGDKP